jgi:ATP-dependent Clp protease ATP-binding subunit ClpB
VILLDEVEKAHPDVFNVFLQIFDDGRATDGQGRTVDFSNTVVLMTSNIGSDAILNEPDAQKREARVMDRLRAHFRPEFLNRLDEIVVFSQLERSQIRSMVDQYLSRLNHLLTEKGLRVEMTERAKDWIADLGYDRDYGARPMKRVFQKQVQDQLANEILKGSFVSGDAIQVDVEGEKVSISKKH